MQNVFFLVDSQHLFTLLSKDSYSVCKHYDLLSKAKDINPFESWIGFSDGKFNLLPSVIDYYTPIINSAEQYKTLVLLFVPGPQSDMLAGLLALLFQDRYKRVVRVEMHKNTIGHIVQAMKKPERVTPDLLYAAYTDYHVNDVLHREFINHIDIKSIKDTSHIKQALLLRFLYERETEIESQKPQRFYKVVIQFKVRGKKNILCNVVKVGKEELTIQNIQFAKALISQIKTGEFVIQSVKKKQVKTEPPKPFTSLTLLADAEKHCKYSALKVLNVLQKLYTGIDCGKKGITPLISYYNTISEYVNPECIQQLREYIYNNYGGDYLPDRAYMQNKHNPQGGAIIPVDLKMSPQKTKKYLTENQYQIYSLIWNRFVASQMKKAISETVKLTVVDDKDEPCVCEYNYETVLFRGYKQVYSFPKDDEKQTQIPDTWKAGRQLSLVDFDTVTGKSVKYERYFESELLQLWTGSGAGTIEEYYIHTGMLFANTFIERNKLKICPTSKGFFAINAILSKYSGFINTGIIIQLNNSIHSVATGKQKSAIIIKNMEKIFNKDNKIQDPLKGAGRIKGKCPVCNGDLVMGDNDKIKCEHYPEKCVYITTAIGKAVNEICDVCGSPLAVREGQYGRFLACTRYPKCKFTKAYSLNIPCPAEGCEGFVVERNSKGRIFYGCSRYPDCSFAAWQKPVNMLCRNCGNTYLVEHLLAEGHNGYQCTKCKQLYDDKFIAMKLQ